MLAGFGAGEVGVEPEDHVAGDAGEDLGHEIDASADEQLHARIGAESGAKAFDFAGDDFDGEDEFEGDGSGDLDAEAETGAGFEEVIRCMGRIIVERDETVVVARSRAGVGLLATDRTGRKVARAGENRLGVVVPDIGRDIAFAAVGVQNQRKSSGGPKRPESGKVRVVSSGPPTLI